MEDEQKMPTKRLKMTASEGAVLHTDAFQVVMEYLAPRELFRLAFCSKELMNSVTTKMVVRSALLHGGHAKSTIQKIAPLMKTHSIFVPTPLRLLRLVNGKRCERLDYCGRRVNHVRVFANFYCSECESQSIIETNKMPPDMNISDKTKITAVLNHPRMLLLPSGHLGQYVSVRKLGKTHTGEIYGPLICYENLYCNDVFSTIEQILVGAPSPEQYADFIQAFDEFHEPSEEAVKERAKKLRQKRLQTAANRKVRVVAWIDKLEARLSLEWRVLALQYEDMDVPLAGKMPILKFRLPFVEEMLHNYAVTPTNMNTYFLEQKSQEINRIFQDMQTFLKFDFLCNNEVFDSKLKSFCVQDYPNLETFLNKSSGMLSSWNCQKLGYESKFEALELLYNNYGFLLMTPERDDKFARYVWRHEHTWRSGIDEATSLRQTYSAAIESYPKLLKAAEDYLNWRQHNNMYPHLDEGWVREMVHSFTSFSYLLNNDFRGLSRDLNAFFDYRNQDTRNQ